MALFDDIKKDIIDAIKAGQDSGTKAYDTEAEVIRTDGSTAWVHIPGGVDETPVKMTIHCEPNDKVQVRVSGGSAWLVGNETAPPTDDTTAIEARLRSVEAGLAAQKALANAEAALNRSIEQAYEMATAVVQINADIENLQDQIDGNITTWYYNYEPTLTNEPASTWNTDADKDNHLGDMFLDMDTGYSYRFVKEGSTYKWMQISDEGVSKALAAAAAAQDTADHKRRVFISTPTPPYDEGDLWCEGLSGEILTCVTAKSSTQVYAVTDWEKLNKYTDDTAANEAKEAAQTAWNYADSAHEAAQTAWDHADEANSAATAAASAANAAGAAAASAQSSADSAMSSAGAANTAANSALTQLSVVEDVVDVLNWVSEHGTYAKTNDTSVVTGKYYFTKSGSTYSVVTNPTGNPKTKGYYELSGVDEAVSNYISSHLALTNQGLWVISDNSSYKILLASDGMKVYDSLGNLVSTFGESITFSSSRPQTIGNSTSYVKFYKESGTWKLAISAQEIKIGSSSVATETYADGKADAAQQAGEAAAAQAEENAKEDAAKKLSGFYATSATAAGTAAKAATITPAVTGWALYKGATITVKFTKANTAASPTLNINSTGAKPIKTYSGAALSEDEYKWPAGSTFSFTYNGANWLMQDSTVLTRIASAETSIEQNAEAITLRATKTEAQGYANTAESNAKTDTAEKLKSYYTKTQTDSQISQSASSITSTVSATYETKTDASSKLSEAKADATTKANAAESNAKTDTANKLKSYSTTTQMNSAIEQKANEIALSVSQAEIEKLEVGSSNMLVDTNAPSLTKVAGATDRYWSNESNLAEDGTAEFFEVTDAPAKGIKYGIRLSATVARETERLHGLAFYRTASSASRITFEEGQTYTMSCYIRLTSGTANRFSLGLESGSTWTKYSHVYFTPTSEWQKISRTFTATAEGTKKVAYFQMCYLNVGIIEACGFKVEKGTFATDWSPAPEDLEAYTDKVVSEAKAEIKVTTDGISTEVSKISSAKYVESSAGGWTLANLKNWAAEGKSISWNVVSTEGLRVGDTVYNAGTDTTRDCPVYIKTVVTAVTSATKYTGISHGYEDALPIETIKSTINQSSDSVKIQAKHVEIDGAAIFNNSEFQEKLQAEDYASTSDLPTKVSELTNDSGYQTSSQVSAAITNGVKNKADKTDAVKQTQRIYYRSSSASAPTAPTTWVTSTATANKTWSTKRMEYNSTYKYLYTCIQKQTVSGTVSCTTVLLDDTTTVIDGGNIITGSVTANQLAANAVTADKIKAGAVSTDKLEANAVTAEKIDVTDLFAQDITATGTITGAELKGAKGTFTRGFDVDILFDMAHGTIIDDKSEAADTWVRKYIRMNRDSVVMGFATDDGEGGETEVDFFRSYRDPAHPRTTLTLASVYLQLYGMYIQIQGNVFLTGSLDVTENAAILGHKMVYEAGDTIDCQNAIFAGHLTTSKKAIEFFIPLPKPTATGLTATMSGNWGIRHADGGYILSGATLASIGTVTTVVTELGVRVNIALATAASFANNSIVDVAGWAGSKITFS